MDSGAVAEAGTDSSSRNIDTKGPIAELSHELRGPVATIQNYCEILLRCPPGDEEQRTEFLRTVADEAERLNRMLGDLLELERLDGAAPLLDQRPCDLRELVERSLLGLHAEAAVRKIEILIEDLAGDLPFVNADPARLLSATSALVENAVRFSEPEHNVVVTLRYDGNMLAVDVSDKGVGVPEGAEERIFERLERAAISPDPNSPQGSGLGLPIARRVARLHGGDVTYNRDPGGSTFTLTIPSLRGRA